MGNIGGLVARARGGLASSSDVCCADQPREANAIAVVLQPAGRLPLLDEWPLRTYVPSMARASSLTESRLDSLYVSEGFGGEKTMRAKVIRELIDEIRALRQDAEAQAARGDEPHI